MEQTKHTPGYEVTETGDVFSVGSNWRGYGKRKLIAFLWDGYLYVRLTIGGKRKKHYIHKLVAAKFLPPRPSLLYEIRHLDGQKTNNHISNLVWGTRKDNAEDREKHGRTSRGIKHSIAIKQGLERRGYNVKW